MNTQELKKVLFIDDEAESWMVHLAEGLLGHGFDVVGEECPDKVLACIREQRPDVVLLDIWFKGEDKGKPTLALIKQNYPRLPVVMLTGGLLDSSMIDPQDYPGASYLFPKQEIIASRGQDPYTELAKQLRKAIEEATKREKTLRERVGFIVGNTPKMRWVAEQILQVAPFDTTVLLTGENGTGKELVARSIHNLSPRSNQPFLAVNCGSLLETILESELFGHEKGAFTDAKAEKEGLFEVAKGGTLFLDEVQDMSASLQVKLLRVLDSKEMIRVGGKKNIPVDVRVVGATNRDLQDLVSKGKFREDLYYRLRVVQIVLPPLRERISDIEELFSHFVERLNKRHNKSISPKLREDLLRTLQCYSWAGNIRELENSIESAMIKARAGVLTRGDFPDLGATNNQSDSVSGRLDRNRDDARRRLLAVRDALAKSKGSKRKAADKLGFTYHQAPARMVEQVWKTFPELALEFADLVEAFPKLKCLLKPTGGN